MTTQSWIDKEAERYAVKQIDGTVRPEVYNTFTKAACASMCMGTAFWRNTYSDLATAAVNDLDVDGIYMDQACSSLACYDPTHGHPLGGGGYWMNGFKQLQADIRERTVDAKQVTLAGEGCGEAWLPYLDLMLSLQVSMERYAAPGKWDPIPFFHAVYHDSAVLYGNYSSLTMPPYDSLWPAEKKPKDALHLLDRKYSKQYRMEQARSFVWGQQPTLANFRENQLSERSEEIAYLLQIARLRYAARKYLMHGVMLRPPALDAPMENFDMSRLSIYAGQGKSLKEYQREYPILLASAWQAPDGDIAVALANISDTAQPFAIALTQEDYPLPDAGRIHCRTVDAVTPVADFDAGEVTLTDTLPAQGLRIYEIRAVK